MTRNRARRVHAPKYRGVAGSAQAGPPVIDTSRHQDRNDSFSSSLRSPLLPGGVLQRAEFARPHVLRKPEEDTVHKPPSIERSDSLVTPRRAFFVRLRGRILA